MPQIRLTQTFLNKERVFSERKQKNFDYFEENAEKRDCFYEKNYYFHQEDLAYFRFMIPEGSRVLDLGCGSGDLLSGLKPSYGVGVDFSPKVIERAQKKFPELYFIVGDVEDESCIQNLKGPFDYIILSDTIGLLEDCQRTLENLQVLCTSQTRIIISYYGRAWEPILSCAEYLGQKMPRIAHNFLSTLDISNLLALANYQVIKQEWRQLLPKKMLGLGGFINRYFATLPGLRRLCLRNYIVARPLRLPEKKPSLSVIITARNEKGNIEPAIKRLPQICDDMEIIFAEGHSKDGSLDEIKRVIKQYPDKNIKLVVQTGKGKGDAVRTAFDAATKDILMILDGDLTTPPEDMAKFYNVLARGHGEFVNGTRLIYPMEDEAMRFLNLIANVGFSWVFSYLLNQRITDTLCGTKVLFREDYIKIAKNRHYFGDFDPFGDFDLIFGATKQQLKICEVPIRYKAREYGETQISRFSAGWMLLRMVFFAYGKLKAF